MTHPGKATIRLSIAVAVALGWLAMAGAEACTRMVYLGQDGRIVTARSMDWKDDIGTNLWIMPRGVARQGRAGPNSLAWTAKYGSVIASGYDIATTDGLNEAGLAANILWLAESRYPARDPAKPGLTIAAWAQYVLDSFATVEEAVTALRREPFIIVTETVPGSTRLATLHLSLSDASGDSAIIEYIDGKQVIHHDRKFQVMTNSPVFDQQLALNEYWKQIGGAVMLPGTDRAADRFVRASYYINAIPRDQPPDQTIASVVSVIRAVSVPYGVTAGSEPNIASTRWRTVIDHKRKLFFFDSATTPSIFWVDLKAIDFSGTAGVRKLDLGPNQDRPYAGKVSREFKPAKPFEFLGLP
jgi:penicillin V acylase-like amidase (Ntn superfamily)